MADVAYAEFPLMRHSALSHYIEINYDAVEQRLYRSHDVSEALVAEMARVAREHGVLFVVAGIVGNSSTRRMLEFAAAHDIAALDMSVDLHVPGNTNAPHDNHPSALANRHYADVLEAFLRAELAKR
jgi:hypothetical protein